MMIFNGLENRNNVGMSGPLCIYKYNPRIEQGGIDKPIFFILTSFILHNVS